MSEHVKPRVALVWVYPGKEYSSISIPVFGYDFKKREKELMQKLKEYLPDIDFISFTAYRNEEIEEVAKRKNEFDGYVIYVLGWAYWPLPNLQSIAETRKPVILISDWLGDSDTFYREYPRMRQKRLPVIAVTSSRFEDVVKAIKLLKVIKRLKESKVLMIMEEEKKAAMFGINLQEFEKAVKEVFGIQTLRMTIDEFAKNYLSKVSESEANAIADMWIDKAERVIEPTREEIVAEAKIYLAFKKVIEDKKPDALLFDCTAYGYNFIPDELFRIFYPDIDPKKRGKKEWPLPTAFPCLAISQLLSDGYPIGDEMNVYSTLNLLVMHYLTKELTGEPRPGFTGGAIFDCATGSVIYHLCAAPYKMYGPNGPANPYIIRSHGESHLSATIQSIMPPGERVTVILIIPEKRLLIMHQGITAGNLIEEKWCRNKLVIKANIEKIIENIQKKTWFISRTVFYGDWRKPLMDLATLLGLEVFEEDK
mgnify:CR=1 FL=1